MTAVMTRMGMTPRQVDRAWRIAILTLLTFAALC